MMPKKKWIGLEWIGLEWIGMDWNGMTWHGTKASSFRFWRKSRTKALLSHLQLSDFEGSLARMLCFRIFHFQILRAVSHESFVSTSSAFRFWKGVSHESFVFTSSAFSFCGKSRTKCVLRDSGCTKCCVLQDKTCPGRWMGKLVRRTVAKHARLGSDHSRIGRAVELPVQASF